MKKVNLTPLRGGLFLNYERREMTRKGFRLSFALSRIFACFVVPNTYCGQRPHQTHLRGFTELSAKANSYTMNLTPLRGGLFLNYERREMTRKGFRLSFAFSRIFACFVVPNTYCGQRPHEACFLGAKELSTKANSFTTGFYGE